MGEPHVTRAEAMTVAFLSLRGAYSQIPQGYATLYQWLAAEGHEPTGMPRAVYLTDPALVPEAQAHFELWAPIAGQPPEQEQSGACCGVKRVPSRALATLVHKGPYDSVAASYQILLGWIAENGYRTTGPCEEAYLNDPGQTSPEEYLTEIAFPVVEA